MFNKRQTNTPGLFQFLTNELTSPCIAYNTTFVRIFNALTSDVKLDVYVDGELFAKELEYKQFSYYIPILEAEIHNIKVFISGKNDNPIIDKQIQIHQMNVETLAIVGRIDSPSILSILGESIQQPYPDKSLIRYANLSQDTIVVNVLLNSTTIVSEFLGPTQYTRYSALDQGAYNFKFVNPESNFQTSSAHILKPTRMYTFYLVGSLNPNSPIHSSYPLELIVSVDIATILKQCPEDMKRL